MTQILKFDFDNRLYHVVVEDEGDSFVTVNVEVSKRAADNLFIKCKQRCINESDEFFAAYRFDIEVPDISGFLDAIDAESYIEDQWCDDLAAQVKQDCYSASAKKRIIEKAARKKPRKQKIK